VDALPLHHPGSPFIVKVAMQLEMRRSRRNGGERVRGHAGLNHFCRGENYFQVFLYFKESLLCVEIFLLEKFQTLGYDSLVCKELNLVDCAQQKEKFKKMK